MIEITHEQFEAQLRQFRDDPGSGLSGPFIHSAPAGNMFCGPFKERAWMISKETVLKQTWSPETGWKFFQATRRGSCTM